MSLKDRIQATAATEEVAEPAAEAQLVTVDMAQNDGALQWLDRRRTYIERALPDCIDQDHFLMTALSIMENLKGANLNSIWAALMECARYGLAPDGKHAAIIKYGKVAKFQPMYQGYIELMYRSGMVDSVVFDWIRDSDDWHLDRGARPPHDFSHKPDLLSEDRGPTILAYAFCWMSNGSRSQVIALNRYEAQHIRDNYSKAYAKAIRENKTDTPWITHFDDMWLKSAVIRLNKRVPTSPQIRELIRHDEALEGYGPPIIRAEAMARDPWPTPEIPAAVAPAEDDEPLWPEAVKPGEG